MDFSQDCEPRDEVFRWESSLGESAHRLRVDWEESQQLHT